MLFIITLALAAVFLLLCGKELKRRPAWFYLAAALVSAAVIGLYWAAPDFLSPALRTKLPIWLGAFGTACFVFVMIAGALPNGHPLMKRIMPVRGELSIFACLVTLGHNLSYGKNYFAPEFLLSKGFSTTKIAARISLVMILLMLVLTITSVKAVRKKMSAKGWKALQRWAYLFYALIYVHVLLLGIPSLLRGREGYGLTLLAYSVVFIGYAICRIQKALLVRRKQASKVTARRQLAGAGVGAALSLALMAALALSVPGEAAEQPQQPDQSAAVLSQSAEDETSDGAPADTPADPAENAAAPSDQPEEGGEPAADGGQETGGEDPAPAEEGGDSPSEPASGETEVPVPIQQPEEEPAAAPAPEPEPAPDPIPDPEPEPEPEPKPEPTSQYRDGTYTGTGEGYYGTITVTVTISNDVITAITIDSYIDDDDYLGDAENGVIPAILAAQSPDVSAVSGATYSSKGIMAAVKNALAQAAN